jgi:hypothetical protein
VTDRRPSPESGPVPVRDLLKHAGGDPEGPGTPSPAAGGPEASSPVVDAGAGALPEKAFEVDGEPWLARPAGLGLYGTGRLGSARLVAVHFFRASEPERPVREALVSASDFKGLEAVELGVVFEGATPIEPER